MNDFLRIITHARRFKSAVKEIGVEQLEEVKIKLQKIIDDRIAEEEAARIENAEKIEKIQKYKELLAEDGIDPGELLDGSSEKQGKRAPRQPKYEIWSEKGEHITWTGQGRMPNVFKARIDGGETLDTFLIDQ
ncbi:H-NS histone family protein [Desulfopila sp. IMCC35006]|uniref:H-NS family histone-like protein n=1 Tax=Desulfopila sp. IMCC35006 TaxID=2569542 RepID=UPI0010AC2EFF|nr:H-NS family nucleoid-associated regulatory protein [Desulfopila sp. IMCC35006]TKB23499.1 H-NS histone family protein [Desulfopila sp. IMCC35006]